MGPVLSPRDPRPVRRLTKRAKGKLGIQDKKGSCYYSEGARRHLLTGQVISQPHLMGLKLTTLFLVPRELAAWGRWHATASHRRHAARARLRAAWLLWPAYGRPCRTLRRLSAPNKSQDLGASAVFGKVGGENRAWRKDRTTRHDHPTGNKVCKATIATGGSIFSVCASHSPLEYLIVTISP